MKSFRKNSKTTMNAFDDVHDDHGVYDAHDDHGAYYVHDDRAVHDVHDVHDDRVVVHDIHGDHDVQDVPHVVHDSHVRDAHAADNGHDFHDAQNCRCVHDVPDAQNCRGVLDVPDAQNDLGVRDFHNGRVIVRDVHDAPEYVAVYVENADDTNDGPSRCCFDEFDLNESQTQMKLVVAGACSPT